MELSIDHLLGYFPYGLMGVCDGENRIDKLLGIYGTGAHSLILCARVNDHNTVDYDCGIDEFKPILRPMSDLTKEIEVNGEKFIPSEKLAVHLFDYDFIDYVVIKKETNGIPFWVIKKLYEWHFDISGLIDNELAFDKNVINI